MAGSLPDQLERIGIVVGSALLLALPTSVLNSVFFEPNPAWSLPAILMLVPGMVVGVLVATDRAPTTYQQVWLFSILAWVLPMGVWTAIGFATPSSQPTIALATLALTFGFAALVALQLPTGASPDRS